MLLRIPNECFSEIEMSAFPKTPHFTNECFSELNFQFWDKTWTYPQKPMLFHNFYGLTNPGMSDFPKLNSKILWF